MVSTSTKILNIRPNLNNKTRTCPICKDYQEMIQYMGYWICKFCAAQEGMDYNSDEYTEE
ncbi:MAG: hypothetical protein ACTSWX_01625 [Promethearchaeota archaeon]